MLKILSGYVNFLNLDLFKASFVPNEQLRHLRNLLRQRKKLIMTRATIKNRIIKTLEMHNIRLASVISDVFGVSGIKVVRLIADLQKLVQCFDRQIRASKEAICKALTGTVKKQYLRSFNRLILQFD
jgi:transposase